MFQMSLNTPPRDLLEESVEEQLQKLVTENCVLKQNIADKDRMIIHKDDQLHRMQDNYALISNQLSVALLNTNMISCMLPTQRQRALRANVCVEATMNSINEQPEVAFILSHASTEEAWERAILPLLTRWSEAQHPSSFLPQPVLSATTQYTRARPLPTLKNYSSCYTTESRTVRARALGLLSQFSASIRSFKETYTFLRNGFAHSTVLHGYLAFVCTMLMHHLFADTSVRYCSSSPVTVDYFQQQEYEDVMESNMADIELRPVAPEQANPQTVDLKRQYEEFQQNKKFRKN